MMSRRSFPCYAAFPCTMNCADAAVVVVKPTLVAASQPASARRRPNEAALASKKPFDITHVDVTVVGGVGKSWPSERSPGRRESAFGSLSLCLGGQGR